MKDIKNWVKEQNLKINHLGFVLVNKEEYRRFIENKTDSKIKVLVLSFFILLSCSTMLYLGLTDSFKDDLICYSESDYVNLSCESDILTCPSCPSLICPNISINITPELKFVIPNNFT